MFIFFLCQASFSISSVVHFVACSSSYPFSLYHYALLCKYTVIYPLCYWWVYISFLLLLYQIPKIYSDLQQHTVRFEAQNQSYWAKVNVSAGLVSFGGSKEHVSFPSASRGCLPCIPSRGPLSIFKANKRRCIFNSASITLLLTLTVQTPAYQDPCD